MSATTNWARRELTRAKAGLEHGMRVGMPTMKIDLAMLERLIIEAESAEQRQAVTQECVLNKPIDPGWYWVKSNMGVWDCIKIKIPRIWCAADASYIPAIVPSIVSAAIGGGDE